MEIPKWVKRSGYNLVFDYLGKNPDENICKVLNWVERVDRRGDFVQQTDQVRKVIADKDNCWYRLLQKVWTDVDTDVLKVTFRNLLVNGSLIGWPQERALSEEHQCNIPWAILMDPTSACNLHCTGCWAADYGNSMNLSLEELESIIAQGKELGIYFYLYSGGEPLVRKDDIITLCERHPDCQFLAFTNATLIDEDFADAMLRVKNFIPAISVEGFEEATDLRRGAGTFARVRHAMGILKARKLPFGVSCCYTSQNAEVIGSEEYVDALIEWGALFEWIFTYMPVGADAVPALLATAEQREFMYRQVRAFRQSKPLFALDFWNDGEYVQGCIAGGRRYLHINANGDIEPCAFIHYSDSNIREKSLLEALKSPLFMGYREHQPFNENHLRPCPALDNPGTLSNIVDTAGAVSTDMASPEPAYDFEDRCRFAAAAWKETADRLWCEGSGNEGSRKVDDVASEVVA